MRNQIKDEDENFENGVLKDGRSFHVDVRMCDAMQRDVAKHASNFTKPTRQRLVDGQGNDGLALHRPGARVLAGGSARTQQAWDAMNQATKAAYALDEYRKANAWKGRDWAPENGDGQTDIVEAKRQAIGSELSRAGGDDDDVEEYLDNCSDEDLDQNVDEHRAAFTAQQNGRDSRTAAVDKAYDDYARRQREEWRRG